MNLAWFTRRRGLSAISQATLMENLECRSLLSTVLPTSSLSALVDAPMADTQASSQVGPERPTTNSTLAAPVADSPGSATSPGPVLDSSTPTFTWEPVTGAAGYQLILYDISAGKPFT